MTTTTKTHSQTLTDKRRELIESNFKILTDRFDKDLRASIETWYNGNKQVRITQYLNDNNTIRTLIIENLD